MRNSVRTKEDTFHLLDELEKYAAIYSGLRNPNDELWLGNKEVRRRIAELKLFGVTQPYPLLLESYFKLPDEFETILRFCSVIAFRYNIIGGLDPKRQEQVFHIAAKKIFKGEITKANQVAQELRSIYLNDEAFVNSFSTKQINTKGKKKLARYILYALENQIAGTDRSPDDESATIEHILPENPTLDWEQYFAPEEQENYIFRIGNLTLLEASKNNECGTKLYADKLPIYKQSQFRMTNTIDYPEWTPNQVRLRQEHFAKVATSIWKISQI